MRCQDCVRVLGLFRSQRHLRVRSHRHASLAQGRAVDQHLALRAAGGEESAEGCRAAAHVHLQYPALQQRAAVLRVQLHGQRVQTQLARPLGRWSQHGWRRSNKHQSLALNPALVGTCCASQSAAQPGGTRQQPRAGAGTGSCKRSRASSAAQQSHHALHVRKGTVHGPLRYLRRGLPGQLRAGEGEGVRADALRSASGSTHYAAELRMCTLVRRADKRTRRVERRRGWTGVLQAAGASGGARPAASPFLLLSVVGLLRLHCYAAAHAAPHVHVWQLCRAAQEGVEP